MVEVDPEVRVVALVGEGDVLDGGDVEGDGNAEDGHDDGVVLLVCNDFKR